LAGFLVLRGPQQDSTEMPEKIGAGDAEFLLREIPGQLREGGRKHQWQDDGRGRGRPAVDPMRDEVVGITPTPRGLRPRASSDLTGRRRTRALATADAPIRHEPPPADTAGPLREHPEMLASSAGNQCGPLLASNRGSILASAEAIVAITLQGADVGDTTTIFETSIAAAKQIEAAQAAIETPITMQEMVADKGHHRNDTMVELEAVGLRTYVSEPERGRRDWSDAPEAQAPVYANRRRIRGVRGKALSRRRGEYVAAFAYSK